MENASALSPTKPHFFQPLLPRFHSYLNIPSAFFSKHINGTENEGYAVVKLRSDASDKTWEVKMVGPRLTQGWQSFATSHDLRVGDIVIFRHDGDLLFHVTCLGPSCCEIQYDDDVIKISSDDDDDDDVIKISSDNDDDDVIRISSDDDDDVIRVSSASETDSDSKNNQNTEEAESSSDDSCCVVRVTASNLSKDTLFFRSDFSRSNGLMNRKCEIILSNGEGKPWTLYLSHHKHQLTRVYMRTGWRSFCLANGIKANDFLTFKLVKTGTKLVLHLCSSSSSTCQYRFFTLTLTQYSLKKCELCLPVTFLKANGIKSARKITLVDIYGIKRTTSLKPQGKCGRMRLGKEWREFCEVSGVKTGESFKLEFIKKKKDTTTHLLKFCSKVFNPL